MKKNILFLTFLLTVLQSACSGPSYTWGYEHAASPVATSAYIRAVLARESGDYALALRYYDIALANEKSETVQQEREVVRKMISNPKDRF